MKITTIIEDTSFNAELEAEHGVSFYIETEKHKLLADTGASAKTWSNAEKLGIDLSSVDTVFISHGHYDHAGGLLSFAERNSHAKIYMQSSAGKSFYHNEKYIGIDKEILKLPELILTVDDKLVIDSELSLFSGITGRTLFPESNRELSEEKDGVKVQDEFRHEQCLVINESGKTVLISGCAHNGIINILDRFKELYNTYPDIVISGFHLTKKSDYTEKDIATIKATAEELKKLPTVFFTGHCTSERAFEIMKPILKDKLKVFRSGDKII